MAISCWTLSPSKSEKTRGNVSSIPSLHPAHLRQPRLVSTASAVLAAWSSRREKVIKRWHPNLQIWNISPSRERENISHQWKRKIIDVPKCRLVGAYVIVAWRVYISQKRGRHTDMCHWIWRGKETDNFKWSFAELGFDRTYSSYLIAALFVCVYIYVYIHIHIYIYGCFQK